MIRIVPSYPPPRRPQATYGQLQRTLDCFEHCVVLVDTSAEGWRVLHTNAAWAKLTGEERGAGLNVAVAGRW